MNAKATAEATSAITVHAQSSHGRGRRQSTRPGAAIASMGAAMNAPPALRTTISSG